MSNSLQWHPRLTHLRVLAALLSLGIAFFGAVLRHGGKSFPPQPTLGGILVALGVGALFLTVRRPAHPRDDVALRVSSRAMPNVR